MQGSEQAPPQPPPKRELFLGASERAREGSQQRGPTGPSQAPQGERTREWDRQIHFCSSRKEDTSLGGYSDCGFQQKVKTRGVEWERRKDSSPWRDALGASGRAQTGHQTPAGGMVWGRRGPAVLRCQGRGRRALCHPFNPQLLIEHLLYAWRWGYSHGEVKLGPILKEFPIWERGENN